MTTEQYLYFAGHLDWLTTDAILGYLDALGLWPPDTPYAVKDADVADALLALTAGLERPDGEWVFKCNAMLTPADLEALSTSCKAPMETTPMFTTAPDGSIMPPEHHVCVTALTVCDPLFGRVYAALGDFGLCFTQRA
jgi:hypothetical protein